MSFEDNPYAVENNDPSGPKWAFNWDMLRDGDDETESDP